ncbi:hypothetical protein LCGC14_1754380 [marine sediment metagenome]|uniref:Uncharacterized protein n=1 Tax=marine sediment metagenome TaxID=412755 RepID=A0A0F9K2I5_9ZZZZ
MEKLKLKINAIIQSIDPNTGEVTKETKIHNLVVNTGLEELVDNGLANIDYVAIGTDNTGVQATDTELGVEITRSSVTPSNEGTGIRLFDKTFTFSSGESYTIVEAGLFEGATVSGSTMFNRLTFAGHEVDVDNGVRVQITITLSAV